MKNKIKSNLSTHVHLIEMNVNQLQLGMYVSKLDRPWLETNFPFQGFALTSPTDIEEVQRQCDYVYIDVEKQLQLKFSDNNTSSTTYPKNWIENSTPPPKKTSFIEEISDAESVYHDTSDLVKSFMEDVTIGKAINVEIAKKAVSKCVHSILNSPDALMWLTQLKSRDEYTSQHSMNVCVFSIALGRQLNLPEPELKNIGLCGMMHDMGKLKIPLEILNKPGRFDAAELAIMQSHPTLGLQLLVSDKATPHCVLNAVYGHHERMDGKGYPRGLFANEIHLYTRIVTIADMYDAISSDRVYKKGKTHLESIHILTEMSGTQLDSSLVRKFIESLGIYPPGNIVEMSTGEVAVIIETNQTRRLRPKITLLLSNRKRIVKPRLIDLTKIDRDSKGNDYVIKRMVRAEEHNINIKQLYKMGILKNIKTR